MLTDTFCHCDAAAVLPSGAKIRTLTLPKLTLHLLPGGLAAMDEEENPHDGPGLIKLDMMLRPRVGIATGNLSACGDMTL